MRRDEQVESTASDELRRQKKQRYEPPAIIHEVLLETRAGTPPRVPGPFDPLDVN